MTGPSSFCRSPAVPLDLFCHSASVRSASTHVRRHGSGWQVQVYAGTDAKRRKQYRYASSRTKQGALDEGDRLLREIRRDVDLDDDCTLAELLDRWFDHGRAARGWSPSTVNEVRYKLVRIKAHDIADTMVRSLRSRQLDAYYTWLRADRMGRRSEHRLRR